MAQLKTPEQILNDVNGKRYQLLKKLESGIAAELEKRYVGKPVEIWVDGTKYQISDLMSDLKETFNQFGWEISLTKSVQSPTENNSVCFLVKAASK